MAAIQASVVLRTLLWFSLISLLAVSSASLAQESDLAVTKTGPAQSAADTDVAYTVTVFNGGPDPAITVTLTDPIPPGMTFVSKDVTGAPGFGCTDPGVGSGGQVVCTGGTIASGGSAVFVFVFHIPAGTADGTFFTNIATSTSPTDPFDENDSGTATTNTPFPPQSDLFVLKSGPSSAGPDADVVYTITVGNNGPDAPATLHFSDTLPGAMTFMSLVQNSGPALNCTPVPVGSGGTITCGAASYPAGASSILTLTGHIPAGTPSGTTFTNTGTVSTKEDDPNPDNNSSETTLTVSATDVFVVKTGPTTAQAGNITYSITVTNGGPDVANTVQFYDPLPGGTTFVSFAQDGGATASCTQPEVGNNGTVVCNWLSLANGAVGQFTLVIFSGANTSITNTAFVTTQSFDTDPGNDQDSVTTSVTQVADLSIVKNGPATASAGSNISYDVTVTNAGPSKATTVSVTDTLEPGLTFVSASGPAGWSCTPASGTITCNTATLGGGGQHDLEHRRGLRRDLRSRQRRPLLHHHGHGHACPAHRCEHHQNHGRRRLRRRRDRSLHDRGQEQRHERRARHRSHRHHSRGNDPAVRDLDPGHLQRHAHRDLHHRHPRAGRLRHDHPRGRTSLDAGHVHQYRQRDHLQR
jgi:uncharacterized repeat protein (TIGR01451 family)